MPLLSLLFPFVFACHAILYGAVTPFAIVTCPFHYRSCCCCCCFGFCSSVSLLLLWTPPTIISGHLNACSTWFLMAIDFMTISFRLLKPVRLFSVCSSLVSRLTSFHCYRFFFYTFHRRFIAYMWRNDITASLLSFITYYTFRSFWFNGFVGLYSFF